MGEHYEFKELAELPYIEYRSDKTNWQSKALKLTPSQYEKIRQFYEDNYREEQAWLKSIVEEATNVWSLER